jgi:two-component system sensor histidine kinase TorS
VRILVAEDNAFNRAVLLAALNKGGHEVMVAVDGQEALDAYIRQPVDLVLLDLEMPRKGGLEVAAIIRARGGRMPILALTGSDEPAALEACRAAGMNGLLAKPVRTSTLWADIERAASERRAVATVDRRGVLAEAGGDLALVRRLIEIFRVESVELAARVRQASDAEAVALAAHALKSVCGHWSQGPAFDLLADIEAAGRAGDLPGARARHDELDRALGRLDHEIRAAFPPERVGRP